MGKDKLTFKVMANEEEYLKQVIIWYNASYQTDFSIVSVSEDEVNFCVVEVSQYRISDVFDLGYQFGVKEQRLREEGKIDW